MATLNFKLAPHKNKNGRYVIRMLIVNGNTNTWVSTSISDEKKSDWLEKQQKYNYTNGKYCYCFNHYILHYKFQNQ